MTLTDLWIRVMESGAKGVGAVLIGWFFLYLLMDKRCKQRRTLWTLFVTWVIIGAGSLNTSVCLYLIKPIWNALGNMLPAALFLLMGVLLVVKSAELREAWILWSEMLRSVEKEGGQEVRICIRKLDGDGMWAKMGRVRRDDAATAGAVGRANT